MFGIPLDEGLDGDPAPTHIMCDNQSIVKNSSLVESTLNKKHNSIAYHYARWNVAAGVARLNWIVSENNLSDPLTKRLTYDHREGLFDQWMYWIVKLNDFLPPTWGDKVESVVRIKIWHVVFSCAKLHSDELPLRLTIEHTISRCFTFYINSFIIVSSTSFVTERVLFIRPKLYDHSTLEVSEKCANFSKSLYTKRLESDSRSNELIICPASAVSWVQQHRFRPW